MTKQAQQKRYDSAWFGAISELFILDAMVHDYPFAGDPATDEQTAELEDLRRQMAALTAIWRDRQHEGIPA